MQYKVIEAPRLKTTDSGAGTLTGYASTWQKDSVGDIVQPGAYRETIADWLRDGFIALGHDWSALPIATPKSAVEDSTGLLISADFHSTDSAQQARRVIQERLQRGKSVKLSIGYEVLQDEQTREGRLLKKLKLWEVSVVSVPANIGAELLSAKMAAQLKEGRVLSSANRAKVQAAIDALQALLDASEPPAKRVSPVTAMLLQSHAFRIEQRMRQEMLDSLRSKRSMG
jgi:HK97 family phage prohead protease